MDIQDESAPAKEKERPLLEYSDTTAELIPLESIGITPRGVRQILRHVVEHALWDGIVFLLILLDLICVTVEALLGYDMLDDHLEDSTEKLLKHTLHDASLVMLAVLLCMCCIEIFSLGRAWLTMKHFVTLGTVVALLYMEMIQCWEKQICTWGGLCIFLAAPFRVKKVMKYRDYLSDVWANPEEYREQAKKVIDSPITHVAIVGLVLSDFLLLGIELLVHNDIIGSGEGSADRRIALETLTSERITIYMIFVAELVLKIFVERVAFFVSFANWIETLTVALCITIELVDFDSSMNYQWVMALRLWRVYRAFFLAQRMGVHSVEMANMTDKEAEAGLQVVADEAAAEVGGYIHQVSDATGGRSDQFVHGVEGVTGIEISEEQIRNIAHIELRTMCMIMLSGTLLVTVVAFFVMYYGEKRKLPL